MEITSEVQREAVERFTAACERDTRVVAAFLGGSWASEKADEWADLDIYVVTSSEDYSSFFAEREAFMRSWADPVYLEDFNGFGFNMLWFTFSDGVEGELSLAPEISFEHLHGGPYKTLVDKKELLTGKTFPLYQIAEEQQLETLHQQIYGFWEALSHFITNTHRKQPWSAYGSLDEMRMKCLKLVRLKHDFVSEHSAYSKVEQYVPTDELLPLKASCCTLEYSEILNAAVVLVDFYQKAAPPLATKYSIAYPSGLEQVLLKRLAALRNTSLNQ